MNGGTVVVALNRGFTALIDAEDAGLVAGYDWRVVTEGGNWYAVAMGDQGRIYLHRLIANPVPDARVEHIGTNTLDNRRANLRVVLPAQQTAGRKPSPSAQVLAAVMAASEPPSERDLCRKFHLSIAELREALEELRGSWTVDVRRIRPGSKRTGVFITGNDAPVTIHDDFDSRTGNFRDCKPKRNCHRDTGGGKSLYEGMTP